MMATALGNVLDGSREQGVRNDLLEPVWKLFARAANEGLGNLDISALPPLLAAETRAGQPATARAG